jgi:large subunit ribosomal protein L6
MSRIGKKPIPVPNGVSVTINGNAVSVKGPKGELSRVLPGNLRISQENGQLVVTRPDESQLSRSMHGLVRTLLNNMVVGVSQGFTKVMDVIGIGYRAQLEGPDLVLGLGFSHPVKITPKPGIKFEVAQDTNTRMPILTVSGIDKEVLGQQCAEIRKLRPPEPYKGKGIRYQGEHVRRKAGKTGKAGGK